MTYLEIGANASYALSVLLAARNSVHTWWIGIIGCVLFAWVFYTTQLYADVSLQAFFVVTSVVGWVGWLRGKQGEALPVRRTPLSVVAGLVLLAGLVAVGYGALLHRFTDAYSPFLDSVILVFSVLGQFLLMGRRIENWYAWLVVNTIAVPLYASRGLYLTAALYLFFWGNAFFGLWRWKRALQA